MYSFVPFFCLLQAIFGIKFDGNGNIFASLSTGKIMGKVLVSNNNTGYLFLGIPFAEAPVGNRRYRPPVPKEKWTGILNCTEYGPACMSNTSRTTSPQSYISEDCLLMNVFVAPNCSQQTPCPVLHHIHGGAHDFGSPRMFIPSWVVEKFTSTGIIFATVGYRLANFGFFSTASDEAPGNYAIYDMIESLRWIQREIATFGGDPNSVTIMGYSSSGMDVSALTMTPQARGLFHRGIAMSGTAVAPSAYQEDAAVNRAFAMKAGCTTGLEWDSGIKFDQIVSCLRKKEGLELLRAQRSVDDEGLTYTGPRVDGPNGLFAEPGPQMAKKRLPFPYMIGTTGKEFNMLALAVPNATNETVEQSCQVSANFANLSNPVAIGPECVNYYATLNMSAADEIGQMNSDVQFFVPAYDDAVTMRKAGAPVYLYSFEYVKKSQNSILDAYQPMHATDLTYVLGLHLFPMDERDLQITDIYKNLFTNFAKFGNPTPYDDAWKPMEVDKCNYYKVDLTPENKDYYHKGAIHFWEDIAPVVGKQLLGAVESGWSSSIDWQTAFWATLCIVVVILLSLITVVTLRQFQKHRIMLQDMFYEHRAEEEVIDEKTSLLASSEEIEF